MLDTLLELPFALNRHREAPLLEERLAFLKYLQERGTSRTALRSVSGQLLHVIDLLRLETLRDVSVGEVKQAARRWGEQQRTNARARTYVRTEIYFEYVAKKWLRFADRLKSPPTPVTWFTDHLQNFARWMTEEQGLSPLSVRSHCWKASTFLSWFAERHSCLSRVRLQDVDEFLTLKGAGSWNRTSVSVAAQALRAFFRHAERRGWCKAGIAGAIKGPRRYVHEGLPDGPTWEEVQRLLHGIEGGSPSAFRARAVLSLFAIYGLRSGEVSRLLLSDFDWSAETFLVTHSKLGGKQPYPLQHEVTATTNRSSNPGCTGPFDVRWSRSASGDYATLRAFAGKRPAPTSPASTICGIPSPCIGSRSGIAGVPTCSSCCPLCPSIWAMSSCTRRSAI